MKAAISNRAFQLEVNPERYKDRKILQRLGLKIPAFLLTDDYLFSAP
jgi:hypothetical protein